MWGIPEFDFSKRSLSDFGQFGDYIGGVWGTVVSAITLIFVFLTWRNTYKSIEFSAFMNIFSKMIETHDAIIDSGEFSFWDRRGVPSRFLREFSSVYRVTRKIVPDANRWSVDCRIDISFTIVFYGLNSQSDSSLLKYGPVEIKLVRDSLSNLRQRSLAKNIDMFKGYQSSMSHYFRNLFGMYNFIEGSNLSSRQKLSMSKIVRTKMSNYDQALLALNVISHLGMAWEDRGFIRKYQPISNIPKRFFNFDDEFDLKSRFPSVAFEWMK
jgi:hypothetical protein